MNFELKINIKNKINIRTSNLTTCSQYFFKNHTKIMMVLSEVLSF